MSDLKNMKKIVQAIVFTRRAVQKSSIISSLSSRDLKNKKQGGSNIFPANWHPGQYGGQTFLQAADGCPPQREI